MEPDREGWREGCRHNDSLPLDSRFIPTRPAQFGAAAADVVISTLPAPML
jgi:hypothetical protein